MNWQAVARQSLLLVAVLLLLGASQAPAALLPPKGKVFLGVSDRGLKEEWLRQFNAFAKATGKHPALLQTFLDWDNHLNDRPNKPLGRWRATKTLPMLHISNKIKNTDREYTLKEIAAGKGDAYLLELNQFLAEHKLPAYVRPLGEPNRCGNDWSPVECTGTTGHFKGGEYSREWYKQAFRRISLIVRGGLTLRQLNAALAGIKLPPLQSATPPATLPKPPVLIVWSTLTAGSPSPTKLKGNLPGYYWPGEKWVGLVAPDFYPDQSFSDLNHLYSRPYLQGKAFGIAEWSVQGNANLTWVRKLVNWTLQHRPRMKMLIYYDGFGAWPDNIHELAHFTSTGKLLSSLFGNAAFLPFADPNAASLPAPAGT